MNNNRKIILYQITGIEVNNYFFLDSTIEKEESSHLAPYMKVP
jgi:hypothetical protein